jgi:iron(III) transport system substrate-binding protein|uniref:extracellular solute-binding protein n=1 Tax=Candidatus Planktophila sp. TaxID=2175601 RepID=UPI00404A61AC
MRSSIASSLVLATALLLSGCSSSTEQESSPRELTIYSGRSQEFIAPFLAEWEKKSGIALKIRYADSAELAAQIREEGSNSPADIFLAQDAGSLGAVSLAGLFTTLGDEVGAEIQPQYIAADRSWIGVTGRARVFAYNPRLLTDLPQSITDLANPVYKSKLGIAPTNSSFQAFVTALINAKGEDFTQKWLESLVKNDVQIFAKNSAIVEAIDSGKISIGLVNHYYTWEVSQGLGRKISAENGFFTSGDLGNMVNVSGAGILKSSKKYAAAEDLINYLTSQVVQSKFVAETHEYSLIADQISPAGLPSLSQIGAPSVDLESLAEIQKTQELLIKVGLL